MTWLLIAYGVGLFFFLVRQDLVVNKDRFRIAWIIFASIPLSHFFFAFIRAVSINPQRPSPRMAGTIASIELWSSGVEWLLLGISLIVFLYSVIPGSKPNNVTSAS